jgi:hypothetical protein
VGGHEHRRAAVGGPVDHLPELAARDRVDAPRRLVQEENLRLVQGGDREGELLAPAERNGGHQVASGVLEAQLGQEPVSPLADGAVGEPVDAAVQPDVLADPEVLVQREALAHVADGAADGLGLGVHVVAGDPCLAGAR